MPERQIIQSSRVVLPDAVRPAAILIENGRILRIEDRSAGPSRTDFGNLVISPGIVDTHVHVNEPGRADWEGFDTATRAAAAGGVTTIVDMPLNSVPATITVEALAAKRACAAGRVHVDVGFWGGVVPGNTSDIEPLVDAGVRGFKCFLAPSGVDEFRHVGERELRDALPLLARRGVPLLVHAEDPSRLSAATTAATTYATYLCSRPPDAEVAAVEMMVRLARESGARIHVVHVASAEAVGIIARAKAAGVKLSAETCPHYLTFAAEDIPDGATEFKCAPPIREARHRRSLREALRQGTLDLVASDHSPAPPALKCPGDFMRAWGGIASLELSLPATWSALAPASAPAADENEALQHLARWLSEAPAALAGFDAKGRIAAGFDADLTIWDPAAETTVDPMRLRQRHTLTPYAGRRMRGVVTATFVRGRCVFQGEVATGTPSGRLV